MKKLLSSKFSVFRLDRRGVVSILFALGSTIFVLMAGFAIDLGIVFSTQSQMRSTADATVLAAVSSLTDSATAISLASSIAEQNMPAATHGTVLDTDDIDLGNWDTDTQTFTENGVPINAVRTIIRKTEATANPINLFFARIINKNTVDLTVTAVALAPVNGGACVLALAPSASAAIDVSGNADVTFEGCDLAANSTSDEAFQVSNGTLTTANCASVVGGSTASSPQLNLTCGDVEENVRAIDDPYDDLVAPTPTACPPGTNNYTSSGDATLSPGTFCGNNFRINAGDTILLESGVYVLDQANFTVAGSATVAEVPGGTGVTIILTDSSGGDSPGQVTINGGADITLAAPTSGTFSGILFFQDKDTLDLSGSANNFNGGSTTNFTGVLYFPNQAVQFSGGNEIGGSECTQIIAGTVDFGGNSVIKSNCTGLGLKSIDIVGRTFLVQ